MQESEALALVDEWTDGQTLGIPPDIREQARAKGKVCREEEQALVYVTLVGWESIEAHVRTAQTEGFRREVGWLLEVEEMLGMVLMHVELKRMGEV